MFLETAKAAARLGGEVLIENLFSDMQKSVSQKQKFDFVTQVDLLSEKKIIDFIKRRHPEHDILAEESGEQKKVGDFQWIIDPLDGTKNYIHGFPMFSVSVALKHKEEIVAAAIFEPMRDELFYAEKNKGAFLNGEKIQASSTRKLELSLIATGFPFRAKHILTNYLEAFENVFRQVSDLRRAGSAALDLAYVACGRFDGFWEYGLNAWDIAAGILLISEAGGTVTDFHGKNDFLKSGHIVAGNQFLHNELLNAVAPSIIAINK